VCGVAVFVAYLICDLAYLRKEAQLMRVFLLSAYPTVRAGLAAVLREREDVTVVGAASPDALGNRSIAEEAPDVILADVDGAIEAEQVESWLEALRPTNGVVLMGAEGRAPGRGVNRQDVARLLAGVANAAEAHTVGFGAIPREATPDEIVAALNAVAAGLIALDRRIASGALTAERAPAPVVATLNPADDMLTSREMDVLQLLAQGLPNKIIANRLHISEHTAKFHVSSIMTKLGAASRTEAVTLAARRGLLTL
jgi:DNA-binding NarL/FixJ family response regulator